MKRFNLQAFAPLLGIALFAVALWTLHRSLGHRSMRDVMHEFADIPSHRLLAALLLTAASYLFMTAYDWLAFRYLGRPMPYPRIALVAFIGYSLSNSFGNVLLTGGSVRYRIYSSWGLSALDITKVVLFCSITFIIGMLSLGGLFFIADPAPIPASLSFLPFETLRPLGIVFAMIVATYLYFSFRRRPMTIGGIVLETPVPRLAFAQIAVSTIDLVSSAAVLLVLLGPSSTPSFGFLDLIGCYLLAAIAGLVSQVPGGLGVFESLAMVQLAPAYTAERTLAALLAYRVIYYLLPLGAGIVLLFAQEVREHAKRLKPVARVLGRTANMLVPNALAILIFLSGAMLLFSGAAPIGTGRLKEFVALLPFSSLYVLEASHFLASLAGTGLLLLARGLQRRSDAAWNFAVVLLGAGAALALMRGFDYEEAGILVLILLVMIPCRGHFYRKARFFSERFTPGWITAIAIVLMTTLWIGRLAYKNVDFAQDQWWRFALHGDAPRHIRAALGAMVALSGFAFARLLRPASPEPAPPKGAEIERVEAIVRQSPHANAWLALLGDKTLLYDETRTAFIMYGVQKRSWIAMGDPVGPADLAPDLIWDFRELCDRNGGWPVFYQVGAANLPLYLDLGLTPLKIGEEGIVPLADFSLQGGKRKNMRTMLNRFQKEECTFEIVPVEQAGGLMPELRRISESWLESKHAHEKKFSLGNFNDAYLSRFPIAMIRRRGEPIAFANLWLGGGKHELSIDLMRHVPDAPPGTMDALFIQLMTWGKEQGYAAFSLGMAPLSGLENRALAPLWTKMGETIFRHGEHFYNFQGLRNFKEKYDPDWHPKYLVSPAGLALPRILMNVSALISGGKRGLVQP